MQAHKKEYDDYPVDEPRTSAIRIYVNKGELQIIDDAIAASERGQNRSGWAANVLLDRACKILGIEYPYKK